VTPPLPELDGGFVEVAPPPELDGGTTFGEPDADWRARSAVNAACSMRSFS
jgi:hypothetical protein